MVLPIVFIPFLHPDFDCGVYAVLFSELYVRSRLVDRVQQPQFESLTVDSVTRWRTETKDLILKLAGGSN